MRTLAIAIAAGALAAGCVRQPAPPPAPPPPAVDPSSPLAAPTYMRLAASGDQFEIQSSQLALQMSTNAAIRNYAQMLVNDHSRMSADLVATAQAAGLVPPTPTLLPQHAQLLQQLHMSPPGAFDESFRNMQVIAHEQALQLHQNYASAGDNAALRAVAARAVPVIQAHMSQAQMMQIAPPPPPPPPPRYRPPARPGERG